MDVDFRLIFLPIIRIHVPDLFKDVLLEFKMYKNPILAKSRDAFLLLQGKNVTFLGSRLAHSGYLSPPYLLM